MDQFDAFVSYSHAADGRLAPAVQSGLQRLARHVFQRRALRVFRDETGLSTNPHLWGSIESAIDGSDWFVLLASPESAASEWVNREVATWIERKPLDHLMIVVTDGDLAFSSDARADRSVTNCLPTCLIDALDSEPRWLDLRWARDDNQLDLRNGRFRAAIADLAAPIHGMAKDDLEGDDVKQQKRAKRLAISGAVAVALLAVVSLVGAIIAFNQRQRADTEANRATAKGLSAQAVATSSTDLDLSLLLAVEGYRRDPTIDSESGLLSALDSGRLITTLKTSLPSDVADVEASADRSILYAMTLSGELSAYDPETRAPIGDPLVTGIVDPWVIDVSRDGSRLAFSGGAGAGIIDTATGKVLFDRLGGESGVGILSPDGSKLAFGAQNGLTVFDLATGSVEYELEEGNASMAFLSNTRLAVQDLGQTLLIVYALGAEGKTTPEVTMEDLPPGGGMELSPDGSTLISGGLQGTAALFGTDPLETKGPVIRVRGSRTGDFAFSPDGTMVQLGSDDGSVSIVDSATGSEVAALTGMTGAVVSEFTADDQLVTASVGDGAVTAWSLNARGSGISTSQQTASSVSVLRTIEGGATAIATETGDLVIAPRDDVAHPRVRRTLGTLIRALDVSESAGLAAAYVLEYDLETGENLVRSVHVVGLDDLQDRTVITMDDALENLSLSPDGTMLALGRRDGRLQVNDVATGATVVQPIEVDQFPCCLGMLVWSPDGTRLHTGGQDGFIRTFDTSTWQQTDERQLTIGQAAIRLSVLTDDGSTIVVPAESGEIFLIDEASGEPIGEPFISAGTQIQRAVLVRGGSMLVAVSRDGKLRVWDVATRRLVGRPLIGHVDNSMSLERVADDVVVTAGANDGQVIEWSLDPRVWIERACALAGRNLTHDEWDAYIGGDYATTCAQWPAG